MGRRRQSNFDDPPRFHRKGNTWYHVTGSKPRIWTKLSTDRAEALRLLADVHGGDQLDGHVTEDPEQAHKLLVVVLASPHRLERVDLSHIALGDDGKEACCVVLLHALPLRPYLDIRGQAAKVRANREKALFSHIFNKAREWGYTTAPNPCQGVKGFKEAGRDRYVTDDEFERVKAHAHFTVADAMDLALLTGQRPADVLKIKRADIRDGALWIVQNKTGARLGIEITGELAAVIDRIYARPHRVTGVYLIQDEKGQPLSGSTLRSRFDKARDAAKVRFQFRDIRANEVPSKT